jgi:hypothetical protein
VIGVAAFGEIIGDSLGDGLGVSGDLVVDGVGVLVGSIAKSDRLTSKSAFRL